MDKNIVAFLREDAYTVEVAFRAEKELDPKTWKYVTNIPGLKVGDYVVVPYQAKLAANTRLAVAEVVIVHTDVEIAPNEDIQYRWVTDVVDTAAALRRAEENDLIAKELAKSYQSNLRRSYAQTLLGNMDTEARERILAITKPHV
jgi:hypothetical protein